MQDALKILIEKLKGIEFALIGTFNLFIQGIDIVPHDLDILTDNQGVEAISKIFIFSFLQILKI